jgi:hypothetical protein
MRRREKRIAGLIATWEMGDIGEPLDVLPRL